MLSSVFLLQIHSVHFARERRFIRCIRIFSAVTKRRMNVPQPGKHSILKLRYRATVAQPPRKLYAKP